MEKLVTMSETSYRIHSLYCGVGKGIIEKRDKLLIDTNGVKDDYHHDKNIILLDLKTYQFMIQNSDTALCMSKFYAHIIIDKPINLKVKDVIFHKDMKLIVTQVGKECHMSNGCDYFRQNHICELSKNTYYLQSITMGEVNINEKWGIIKCINTQ